MRPESPQERSASLQSAVPSPRYFADPYPYFAQMRDVSPVFWSENLNAWLVTDYEVASKGLRDQRFSSNRKQNFYENLSAPEKEELKPLKDFFDLWLMFIDPPYHDKLKTLFAKPFSPKSMQQFSESIEKSAESILVDETSENIEFLDDFAIPYSVDVVSKILGVEASDYMGLVHSTEQLLDFLGGSQADIEKGRDALSSYEEVSTYLRKVASEKRRNPQDDIISSGVSFVDAGKITETELLAIVANLLVDGHEPIAHTLSNGILALAQNQGQYKRLQVQPQLIVPATEEILRFNPFFQYSARRATEEIDLAGTTVREYDRIMFMLGGANRDPSAFPQPDDFIVDRSSNKHLSFGQGSHYCLGAALGRLATRHALSTIVETRANLQLNTQELEWKPSVGYRGLTALPIKWNTV